MIGCGGVGFCFNFFDRVVLLREKTRGIHARLYFCCERAGKFNLALFLRTFTFFFLAGPLFEGN
jgi:hypothetical protein